MKETASETEKAISPSRADGSRRWLSVTLKIIVPLAVSVGLCWVLMRGIDFGQMMEIVRTQCDFRYIALMMAMSVLPMVFRAMRWGIQLRAIGVKAPLHILCYSIFGTYAVNIVFPRLGEVWRTGYIAYRQHAPFPQIFGSMVADRLADLVVVGLLTLFTLIVAHGPVTEFVSAYPKAYTTLLDIITSPFTWIAAAAAATACWMVLTRSHNRYILKIKQFMTGLWDGFASIARMRGKMQWLGLTICIWGCYFLQMVIALNAFPMIADMLRDNGLILALVCFVLISISMGIPSNGGIGPYQTALLFGLTLFMPSGVEPAAFKTTGAALGNVIMASQTMFMIVIGIITFILIAVDKHRRHPATKQA